MTLADQSRGYASAWICLIGLMVTHLTSRTVLAAERPNVLIIGDSISVNYTPQVQQLLKEKANVKRVPDNCRFSSYGAANIENWVAAKNGMSFTSTSDFGTGMVGSRRKEQILKATEKILSAS